jgi:DNA polymerase-3 subunit beta
MNIRCAKEDLSEGLSLVARTVSARTPLPILECILLTADERGITLTANDLEMGIETAPIPADVLGGGTVALNAKLFNEIVRKMPDGTLHIETDADNITVFKSGKARFKVFGMPGEEFPVMPALEKTEVYTLSAKVFKDMVRQTIFSVAPDDNKPILTGELLQYRDGGLNMVAVDGFRIAFTRQPLTLENEQAASALNVVVPAKALHELSRVLPADSDESVRFYFTEKRIVFELPRFTFVSRLLEGNFMRYDQILHGDYTTHVTLNRVALLSGLERAVLISKEPRRSSVMLDIQENAVLITSNNNETGNSYDEIEAEVDGNPLKISFNTRYLIEALRALDEESVIIRFTTGLSPCIVRGLKSDDCKYLILPQRTLR